MSIQYVWIYVLDEMCDRQALCLSLHLSCVTCKYVTSVQCAMIVIAAPTLERLWARRPPLSPPGLVSEACRDMPISYTLVQVFCPKDYLSPCVRSHNSF